MATIPTLQIPSYTAPTPIDFATPFASLSKAWTDNAEASDRQRALAPIAQQLKDQGKITDFSSLLTSAQPSLIKLGQDLYQKQLENAQTAASQASLEAYRKASLGNEAARIAISRQQADEDTWKFTAGKTDEYGGETPGFWTNSRTREIKPAIMPGQSGSGTEDVYGAAGGGGKPAVSQPSSSPFPSVGRDKGPQSSLEMPVSVKNANAEMPASSGTAENNVLPPPTSFADRYGATGSTAIAQTDQMDQTTRAAQAAQLAQAARIAQATQVAQAAQAAQQPQQPPSRLGALASMLSPIGSAEAAPAQPGQPAAQPSAFADRYGAVTPPTTVGQAPAAAAAAAALPGWANQQTLSTEPKDFQEKASDPIAPPRAGERSINDFKTAVQQGVTGNDLYNYLPTLVRNRVQGMVEGRVQAPGTRNKQVQALLNIATTIDPDFSDNVWKARSTMWNDLAKSTQGSAGGILSNGGSAVGHLGTASDQLVKLGNYAGPDIPYGGEIGSLENRIANRAGLPATRALLGQVTNTLGRYGQESTKFYSGTAGTGEERGHAAKAVDPYTTTSLDQASYLESESDLMKKRFQEKENQIRGIMGDAYLQKHPVFTPSLIAGFAKVENNIARLRGEMPKDGDTAAPTGTAPKTRVIGGKKYQIETIP